jgi:hypothetical protein
MIYIRLLVLSALLWIAPVASAATLSVDPSTVELTAGETVTVTLTIESQNSINTVGTAVIVPQGLRLLGFTKGMVLTDWIDTPFFEEKDRSIFFSGIIAGGWNGEAVLLTLQFVAEKAGIYTFAYDPARTEVYKNDGKASVEPILFGTSVPPSLPPLLFGVIGVVLLWALYCVMRKKVLFKLV